MNRTRVAVGLLLLLGLLACESQEARLASHREKADALLAEKKWAEAGAELAKALQIDPNSAPAHYALARAYLGAQDARRGYWELEETVRLDPNHVEGRLRLGEFLLLIGKPEELERSLANADVVLALEPGRWEALVLKARTLEQLGRSAEAGPVYASAVEAAPDQAVPLLLRANHLRNAGQKEDAEAAFRLLTEKHSAVGSWTALAAFLAGEGRDVEAEAAFRQAIAIAKPEERAAAWSALASFLLARQRSADAEAVLKEAIAAEPGNLDLIYGLARFYHGTGRIAEADAMIEEASRAKPGDAEPLLLLSAYRGRSGDLAGALEAADRALAIAPENPLARLRRAEVLVDLGFRDKNSALIAEGEGIARGILSKQLANAEAQFVQAKVELARQNYEEAILSLRRSIDARPDWAQAHYLLGTALYFSGDPTSARSELARAVELDPASADGHKMLSRVHAKLGDHALAIQSGQQALARDPADVATRIHVADSLAQERRFDEALELLSAIPEEKRGLEGNYAIGGVYALREAWADARRYYGLALAVQPNSPQVLAALVKIDAREGRPEDAYARVRAAREASPQDAGVQVLFGDVAAATGRRAEAEAAFRRAIELDPNALTAHTKLAELLVVSGRSREAVETYQRALERNPKSGTLHLLLAILLEALGQAEEAMRHYDEAIVAAPELAVAKNNLAYLLAERGGDLDRALDLAQEAKADLPDNPNAADTLGWVLFKKNVPAAAIGYLREAVGGLSVDDPSLPLVRHHLAQAYEANEERALALEALEAAVAQLDAQQGRAGAAARPEAAWAQQVRADLARLRTAS